MSVQDKLFTVDDLINKPDDGKMYELHYGVLIEVAASKFRQARLAIWVAQLLSNHITQNHLKGSVSSTDVVYVLSRYNTRVPDVGYSVEPKTQQRDKPGILKGAPDLSVEISEAKATKQILDRAGAYLDAGTKLVWILYPEIEKVDVYRGSGEQLTIEGSAELDGYDVLPGLKLTLTTLLNPFKS